MPRLAAALAAATAFLAALAAPAIAHQGDPRYRSIVRGVAPAVEGLRIQVLNYDDRLELDNRTGETVLIRGYQGEPYARIAADGTVAVNRRSPASYLNDERYANVPVPADVRRNPDAPPRWEAQDRTGRFEWHDHRMHWMAKGLPDEVRGASGRTRVFDYRIPLEVAGRPAEIAGTLWWVGEQDGGGFPVAAAVSLGAVALLALGAVVLVRRRRGAAPADAGDREGEGEGEARPETPEREAW